MKIVVKKGLDIPIGGQPKGPLQYLPNVPTHIGLNLASCSTFSPKLLVKVGDAVKLGQPIVENKNFLGQVFVSPAGGIVTDILRGEKRRLDTIIIALNEKEEIQKYTPYEPQSLSQQEILQHFMERGLFLHIRSRPFNLIPNPNICPRAIFVTAVESRPFAPSYELQLEGKEIYFQVGLEALKNLTSGLIHLVYRETSQYTAFINARNVEKHFVSGPHPAGNSSLHIHKISPISSSEEVVWTVTALDVAIIGKMFMDGDYLIERVIGIGGSGISKKKCGFFKGRMGYSVSALVKDFLPDQPVRWISGDPLTGMQVKLSDFLGFNDTCLSVIVENVQREAFHFMRFGKNKFSSTHAYLSGYLSPPKEGYDFTTNQHGEPRAFVDGTIYDRVMPMRIPTIFLVKALLAEDFETAQKLGLLEVIPEDFALAAFIDPSKIDIMGIVKSGLERYAKEMGH